MAKSPSPRAMAGAGATIPGMPKVNVTKQVNTGKKSAPIPKPKVVKDITKSAKSFKPKVPAVFNPLGGGTGEENPQVTPKNSPRGVKQQIPMKNPFGGL